MADTASTLVQMLADFRTRAEAKRELIRMGAEAVDPLIEALSTSERGVLWSVVSTLGTIGDPRAVRPLVRLLEGETPEQGAVVEALEAITGKRFGTNVAKWCAVASEAPGGETSTSEAELVKAAIDGTEISMSVSGPRSRGVACRVPLPGGRSQQVKVYTTKDPDGASLLAFYTECGPADPARYEWALRKNMCVPFGRFAVRDVEGHPTFVMVAVLPRTSATSREIMTVLHSLGEKADRLERYLRHEDIA
ncbi:MAG: HEAT repeat domain-containing protein [Planctomycetota bacterium]